MTWPTLRLPLLAPEARLLLYGVPWLFHRKPGHLYTPQVDAIEPEAIESERGREEEVL